MKYEDGQTVRLGDIIDIGLGDGLHRAKVVLLGDTGAYAGLDDETAKWAIESKHVGQDKVMAVWIENNPLAHNDPNYAPVANSISTCLCGVALVQRENGSQ